MASFTDSAGSPQTCELADLLVVVDDLTTAAPHKRWATLIQAKMASIGGGKSLSASGDLVQLELLSHWPAFSLSSGFASGLRDFSTCSYVGTTLDCGRYGLIEPQPNPKWKQHPPAKRMSSGDELGTFLAKMIESGQVGYGREATGRGDDWSRTVDELVLVTSGLVFTHSSGFSAPQPRQKAQIAFVLPMHDPLIDHHVVWMDGPPPSGGRPDRDDGPGEGLSFLHIGVTRLGDERLQP